MNGWIGVDLDGTLAYYDEWRGPQHIGEPIPAMVARVKGWLAEGRDVRIFTARVYPRPWDHTDEPCKPCAELAATTQRIESWCQEHLGVVLPVTFQKDYGMVELWDDRAVQVVPNTGRRADGQP